ncbi:MAG: ZIP family metal transporter [Methanolinea sp.]|nr:ZIP family metal transporter [Methanolinea sp.]
MFESFTSLDPLSQAFIAGCVTWAVTLLGAATVFLARGYSQPVMDGMLGFAGGVMIAASFWSLLLPSLEMTGGLGYFSWVPAAAGFAAGWVFLTVLDLVIPHVHVGLPTGRAEGIPSHLGRPTLLALAVTIHNIPEGLAVGVAFGGAAAGIPEATFAGAVALTAGIAVQNFPEGIAVAFPLYRGGVSRRGSFLIGALSAAVEPVSALAGAAVVFFARFLLPLALAFAAGAMIFVVIEEVMPESLRHGYEMISLWGFLAGFLSMMALDVGFG